MRVTHPEVDNDLVEAVSYFDSKSNIVGDKFLRSVQIALDQISENPLRFHPYNDNFRRCNLRGFPFHIIYEIDEEWLGILVVRHDHRHPNFGLNRTWPS